MLAPFLLCTPMAASREHLRHQEVTAMAGAFSRFGGQGLAGSVDAQERVLRHTSAYDEMIGGPEKTSDNLLEVPLADNQLY